MLKKPISVYKEFIHMWKHHKFQEGNMFVPWTLHRINGCLCVYKVWFKSFLTFGHISQQGLYAFCNCCHLLSIF
jgi:hypothetical protein